MRVRILRRPAAQRRDGLALDRFEPGLVYDVGTSIGSVLLADGWAEPVDDARPALVLPLEDDRSQPLVLIVDDDQHIRTMLGTLLTLEGYAVITAFNGDEAMTMVQRHAPTLILLDLEMPVMDGFGFRAAQRRLASPLCDIPVVIVSGLSDANQFEDGLGAAAVMPKPVDAATLLTAVRALTV